MKIHTATLRLLEFMEFGIKNKFPNCATDEEFRKAIGYPKGNFHKLKKQQLNLTVTQIEAAIKAYGIDANWVFGVSNTMFRTGGKTTMMQDLQIAVANLERELASIKDKTRGGRMDKVI